MLRRNFGGTSGVIVDVCNQHGVWFEGDELVRAARFIRKGGLDRTPGRTNLPKPPLPRREVRTRKPWSPPSPKALATLDLGRIAIDILFSLW
jgi:hypothetical protein